MKMYKNKKFWKETFLLPTVAFQGISLPTGLFSP